MSLVRLTVIGNRAFAPEAEGALSKTDADALRDDPQFVGPLGRFPLGEAGTKAAAFAEHLTGAVAARTAQLPAAGPVVVLVHGFWYDPADATAGDCPHRRNFHFRVAADDPQVDQHWSHTSSWPLGLGFDKADATGASGLCVAFGWDSKPDILKSGEVGTEAKKAAAKALVKLSFFDGLNFVKALGVLQAKLQANATGTAAKRLAAAVVDALPTPGEKSIVAVLEAAEGVAHELDAGTADALFDVLRYVPDFYKQAYARAEHAAWVLANALSAVAGAVKDRPIDLFCHSLGSRVVVQALRQMAGKKSPDLTRLGRIVVVGGAEYNVEARKMLTAVENAMFTAPAFYNFMGRRDRVLTHIAGKFHPIDPDLTEPVGTAGLGGTDHPHWVDVQLDKDEAGKHPFGDWVRNPDKPRIAGREPVGSTHPLGVLNHWYYFTNPANMEVFRAIFRDRANWTVEQLKAVPKSSPVRVPGP